jgi:chromosome segregation ATPase
MARRRAIEADELFETANRLLADGKEVTAVALLDALGGGSLRTIYKHLETWQAMKPAPVIMEPSEIPPQVQAAFASAWRLAAQEAGREVQAVKEKSAEEVSAALRQFHGALEAIGKLEQDSEADAKEIEELKDKLASSQAEVHAAKEEGAGYKAAAEQLKAQVTRLEKDLDHERKQAKEAADKHYQEKSELTSKVEMWTEQVRLSKERNEKLDSDYRTLKDKHQGLVSAREQAQAESKAKTAERDAAIKEAAQLKGRIEGLEKQAEQLLERLSKSENTK